MIARLHNVGLQVTAPLNMFSNGSSQSITDPATANRLDHCHKQHKLMFCLLLPHGHPVDQGHLWTLKQDIFGIFKQTRYLKKWSSSWTVCSVFKMHIWAEICTRHFFFKNDIGDITVLWWPLIKTWSFYLNTTVNHKPKPKPESKTCNQLICFVAITMWSDYYHVHV